MHWMSRRRSNTMEVSFIDQDLLWGALKFIFPGLTISWGPTPQYLFTLLKLSLSSLICSDWDLYHFNIFSTLKSTKRIPI